MSAWTAVIRQRATTTPDPYNPDRTVTSWADPDEITLQGFLDSQQSVDVGTAGRLETTSNATLNLADPAADVQRGDRIKIGDRLWNVVGFPPAPMNPFTGWRPWLICTLREVTG